MNSHLELSKRPFAAGGRRFALAVLLTCSLSPWVWAETRPAHVAGRFYPAEQTELLDLVNELLERQPAPVISDSPAS